MMKRFTRLYMAGIAFAACTVAGFADVREVKVVGTGDGIDLLRLMADDFRRTKPDVVVDIPPSIGSGGGIAAVGSGKAYLGRIARALSESERAAQIDAVPIAAIPAAFFVNRSAGVTGLGSDTIAAIFEGRITNWADVGGANLRIRIVRREEQDSTLGALRNAMPGWSTLIITERSKTAATTQEAMETIRDVPGTIGFGPYARNLPLGVIPLSVDGLAPDSDRYPAKVGLALIYRQDLADADAHAFVRYATSQDARRLIVDYGAIPAR